MVIKMTEKENKNQQLLNVSEKIFELLRDRVLAELTFLGNALGKLEIMPYNELIEELVDGGLSSDMKYLCYDPKRVIALYKRDANELTRNYLHMVLHGVFQHMFVGVSINRPRWDLACDIAVEMVINEADISCTDTFRKEETRTHKYMEIFNKEKIFTAEQIYNYLEKNNISEAELASERAWFYADDHSLWYLTAEERQATLKLPKSEAQLEAEREELRKEWEKVSRTIKSETENFGKNRGDLPGCFTQNIRQVTREKYDYSAFLKKFAVMNEVMRVSEDEFDYNFYTYGLSVYGNMPLVEPLEYREEKRIRDFVIAIDTSGSVEGQLVQKFFQKTYNILKSTESFFSKVNIYIIQCDSKIQSVKKITSLEDFDDYIKTMKLRGFGGTDFRPVFNYVDKLIEEGELERLKGIIYFTDGYGYFPDHKPDYDAAFVFVEDEDMIPSVPPWAIKLVLSKIELQGL